MNQPPSSPQTPQSELPARKAARTKSSAAPRLLPQAKVTARSSRRGGWLATLGAIALLSTGAALTVGGAWLSFQLIVNPDTAIWLNRYLPAWTQLPVPGGESLKTLSEVRTQIEQEGLVSGEILPLTNTPERQQANTDLLLPVLNQDQQIIELRVYRPAPVTFRNASKEPYFWLVSHLDLTGPEESFVIAPLVTAQSVNQGSSRSLPLKTLERFQEKTPSLGIWLNLRGEWSQGDVRVPYGYLVHYNPARNHLSLMVPWTSPGAVGPQWQQITGDATPELVVNQTIGLEPQFKVYQLKPRKFLPNPVQLEPIALNGTSLKSQAYDNALILARSGLWSLSLQWLQSLKRRNPVIAKRWSADVQAQLSLINLHAKLTEAHAKQTWANPSEQVLVYLIDGRWSQALQLFQTTTDGSSEIAVMLKTDSGRLWRRVTAALKVNSNQPDVKAWGALIVAAKQGRGKAIAWLRQQGKTSPAVNTKIYQLLNLLDQSLPNEDGLTSYRNSQIIGSVKPLAGLNGAAWIAPDPRQRLALDSGQRWYAVTVSRFHDGKTWRRAPFSNLSVSVATVGQVWNLLGLNSDNTVQILVWTAEDQQIPVPATVKALQFQAGELRLLAAGEALPTGSQGAGPSRRPLALTSSALQWIEPGSITLADLNQQNPALVTTLLQNTWKQLRATGQLRSSLPNLESLLQPEVIGDWQVQQVDLTGNNQPETLFTFDAADLRNLQSSKPQTSQSGNTRTIIFSDRGTILYSEFGPDAGRELVAIADLTDGGLPGLVIGTTTTYTIQRWSPRKQRFE